MGPRRRRGPLWGGPPWGGGYRGEGHGGNLLAWIAEWAEERDCEHVALANYEDNEEGIAFYEDNGMETWGYVVETKLD